MATGTDRRKSALLREAAKRLTGQGRAKSEAFLRQYYANVSVPDLIERGAGNLAGGAQAIFKFAANRKPGEAKIRVYNPGEAKDGWECGHTVIEIVNDDMPFLVDSVTAELSRQGLIVYLVIHPVIQVHRDASGALKKIIPKKESGDGFNTESVMSIEVSQQRDPARLKELEKAVKAVLVDVKYAVADWRTMRNRVQEIIDEMKLRYAEGAAAEVAEAQDFLQWLHDDNFTFLGYRDYDFSGTGTKAKVSVNAKTGLGILRDPGRLVFDELRHLDKMPADVRRFVRRSDPVVVSKADARSTVHRPVRLDAIGVKRFDKEGKVVGERLIVGLFTSVAYSSSPRNIPFLRRKLDKTVARAGLPAASHDGKALLHILETYPRDELFQIRDDDLLEISMGVLQLQERQRVALFVRQDDFDRFVSCLVYIPRDRYTTGLGLQIQKILSRAFDGEVGGFNTEIGDSPLARLHLSITTRARKKAKYDHEAVEAELAAATQSWADNLRKSLSAELGEEVADRLLSTYAEAFPASYTERFSADAAVGDIQRLEETVSRDALNLDLYRPADGIENEIRFKVFHPHTALPLSDVLPVLEHMGLKVIDEVPHDVHLDYETHQLIMIHDFGLVSRSGDEVDLDEVRDNFHEAFRRVWSGEMESDGFNALVLSAGLTWREISILRAFAKYLRQTGIPFSQDYMEQTLCNNHSVAAKIVRLFQAKFDPDSRTKHNRLTIKLGQEILDELELVDSADEDRILRRFLNLVEAALRTNYYQFDAEGQAKPYIAIKYDSGAVEELPLPRPLREIFVYSPRVEAIHLRGGMVARGGLRWSDRPEDFRTEILGLMKAQMVKNTVIVPVGSKGGFVVKRPPVDGGREAFLEEGIACYKIFMSGLLDITDNIVKGKIEPPKRVVREDGDDPYLVVAADKGTATFSDIANGVALDYGFWLGDAFASGGSVGYDHKKMGITARGAWESVKRHFREMGKDIQSESFTAVGVGDMSGDVFGNGMLLSEHTKLIAAFNHMHIFIDPDPDPAKSFAERKRLFGLARSSWSDYDTKVLSEGGGIFERRAKTVTLTPEIKKALGVSKTQMTPNELIRTILTANVELLWFGGIGTYVKSSHESNVDAGDRSNDSIRVDAAALKCSVIGEGANLGVTQLGRIEYAQAGGRLNTDFIDNSAGVDCSDHEVNIKILLNAVVAKKGLTGAARNKLLESMTDEVGQLVLRDNYQQSQAISVVEAESPKTIGVQGRFIRYLEKAGRLDRSVEFLPNDEELSERERAGKGLTRPEIAVLMSYAKLWLYDEILDSDLPEAKDLEQDLISYFPEPLREKYKTAICDHQLRRELIATMITNSMINRVCESFVTDLMERTSVLPSEVARAYIVARACFNVREIWAEIESLDNKIPSTAQVSLLLRVNQLLERVTFWLLRNVDHPMDLGATTAEFAPSVRRLAQNIENVIPPGVQKRANEWTARFKREGAPEPLARQMGHLMLQVSALDIVRTASACKLDVETVAKLYFEISERFGIGWLRLSAEALPVETHWQKLAIDAVIEELYAHQKAITLNVVLDANGADNPLDEWIKKHQADAERAWSLVKELKASEQMDLSMLAVASRRFAALAHNG